MTSSSSSIKNKKFDFPVPKDLRQSSKVRVYRIGIDGDDFVIEFADTDNKIKKIKSYITGDKQNDVEAVRKLVESELSFFFDHEATQYCTDGLSDTIDKLYENGAAHAIETVKKHQRIEAAKLDEQGGLVKEKQVYAVKKYSGVTTTSPNGIGLAEAVIIGGQSMFAVMINSGRSVTFFKELETEYMILRPPSKQEYPPDSAYEFASEDELIECIRIAQEQDTIYSLYKDVRQYYTRDYFVDTEPRNSAFLALYTITSYFQDKFSTVSYTWLIGDNGSGKNSILITYSWLGYRVFYMSGASGANICEYLGTVEEGQGSIAEDELSDLDNDPYKKLLYMNGYASGSCVPKVLDGNTKGREQRYYRPYCQKMSASENLPSMKYSKGVLDREFPIKCVKGFPKYNVKATKKRTRTPEVLTLINDLQTLRKRLFAYRLVHFDDEIPEVQGLSISGRALELTESALQLFHKHKSTQEHEQIFNDEILPTLSAFLSDRSNRRNDSIEARLYSIIKTMIDANDGQDAFSNETIFGTVQSEMEGRELPGKTDIFYVDDLSMTVTRTKIMKVLREKFKAANTRITYKDGSTKRGLKISSEVLERIKASYEDPWEIKILSTEDTSDQVNQPNQVLDRYRDQNDAHNQEQETDNQEEAERENAVPKVEDTPINAENEQKEAQNGVENTSLISTVPGLPGFVGQSYSIEDSIIGRAMTDAQGNNKGYFTKEDYIYCSVMEPNYHCTEAQAEQTFYALLEDKIVEIEPGKYKPIG